MANHTIIHSDEVYEAIIERIAAGETLRQVCRDFGMPDAATVRKRVLADEAFAQRYAYARGMGLDHMAEEAVAIADDSKADPDPNSRRVRVDTRKWLLSKLRPGQYGDKLAVTGDQGGPVELTVRWLGDGEKP